MERRRNPADRRAYTPHATAKGRRALRQANEAADRAEAEFLARIPGADRDRLRSILRRLVAG